MIYQLETHIAQQLKDFFDNFDFIDKVVIFGSRAKHTANPKSDIDLCIYSLEMSDEQFSKLRFELDELPILYKLDIVHFEKVNKELQDNVEKDGKLLYQKYVNLFSICRPKQHKTISKNKLLNDGAYNVYGANGIIGKYDKYTHEEKTLLITCRGATSGNLNISEPKSYVNGNAMALDDLSENVNLKYLYYFLSNRKLNDVISGSAQPQITRENLEIVQIYFPTLTKQKKIAKVLDRVNELITLRKESIKKLDDLSKSIFIDMFGEFSENEKNFTLNKLKDLIAIDAKMVQPNIQKYENLFHIGSDRIEKNTGKLLEYITAKEEQLVSKKFLFDNRYILYSKIRPYLNKVANVDFMGLCSADIYPVRPSNEKINKIFLWKLLLSSFFLKYTESLPSRASIPKINREELLNFEFPLPPITLQNKFANIIEKIEEQKALYEKELKLLEDNFNSLLQRSFS